MCGRYVSPRGPEELVQHFGVTEWCPEEALEPSWNVAPTNRVWAVPERSPREDREAASAYRALRPLRWGLVPCWAKDERVGARLINARAGTVHEEPAFRRAFAELRCLLPADGFCEGRQVASGTTGRTREQPYFISPEDGRPTAFAELHEYWRDPEVERDDDPAARLTTCTVITTEATDAAGRVHPRMPLALTPDHYDAWPDPRHQDPEELRELPSPPAGGHLGTRPVSPAVNNVRDDGPALLEETPP